MNVVCFIRIRDSLAPISWRGGHLTPRRARQPLAIPPSQGLVPSIPVGHQDDGRVDAILRGAYAVSLVCTPLVRQVPHLIKLARVLTMRTIGEGLWMTGTVGHGKAGRSKRPV